jgi:CRISPR/Cas system-associated endonuclease/helicase Cas3
VDRLDQLRTRYGLKLEEMRQIKNFEELTSRHSGASLKKIMDNLALPSDDPNGRALDIVVCSNIIEVGVDIDRLSLLTVLNQPKSVATYIQVAGRIGRKWMDSVEEPGRPGLVLTIYSHLRSRDLAYYEMFKSFHQSMYKYVESSSITPFSRPVLERSLHAAMVAYVRLLGGEGYANVPYPFPNEMLGRFKELIVKRVIKIDPNEQGTVEEIFLRRLEEWQNHQETEWETNNPKPDNVPIMYKAGNYVSQRVLNNAWSTQTSMRSVDKECMVEIFNPKNERQSKKMMNNE